MAMDWCHDCTHTGSPQFAVKLCPLHAAAPALAEALREIHKLADSATAFTRAVTRSKIRRVARAALAAAEGRDA